MPEAKVASTGRTDGPLHQQPLPRGVFRVNLKLLHLAAIAVAATRAVLFMGAPPPANPARGKAFQPSRPLDGLRA
jgi:hypothetical protein